MKTKPILRFVGDSIVSTYEAGKLLLAQLRYIPYCTFIHCQAESIREPKIQPSNLPKEALKKGTDHFQAWQESMY